MYFKVALLITATILISGCSNPFSKAKPKNPKKKPPVEVVEEIEQTPNVIQEADAAIVQQGYENKKTVIIKPEPFSIESDEEDPELLGPQSTIKDKLKEVDKKLEEKNKEENLDNAKNKPIKDVKEEIKKEVSKKVKTEDKEKL